MEWWHSKSMFSSKHHDVSTHKIHLNEMILINTYNTGFEQNYEYGESWNDEDNSLIWSPAIGFSYHS